MTHILDGKLAIDVDNDHKTGWPNGLTKLSQVRLEEQQRIEVAFFDPHLKHADGSFVVTTDTLDEWTDLGGIAGLRYDPRWDGYPPPEKAAKIRSDHIARFELDGKKRVQVFEDDVETHDRVWQIKYLLGFKRPDGTIVKGIRGAGGSFADPAKPTTLGYRWGRPFVWTWEGRQTENESAADVAALAGGKTGPQPYNGAMTEVWDDMREFLVWVRSGLIPPSKFTLYADAARLHRPLGMRERILFATSRLTELYL